MERTAVSAGPSRVALDLFLPLSGPAQESRRGTQAAPRTCSDFQLRWILVTSTITPGYVVRLACGSWGIVGRGLETSGSSVGSRQTGQAGRSCVPA